jgi:hypothetical protein
MVADRGRASLPCRCLSRIRSAMRSCRARYRACLALRRDRPREHSCPESRHVFGLDLSEFLADDLLDPLRLFVEMRRLPRTFQPGLARSLTRGKLLHRLRDILAQRNPQRAGSGLGPKERPVRDLRGGLHAPGTPCLLDLPTKRIRPARACRSNQCEERETPDGGEQRPTDVTPSCIYGIEQPGAKMDNPDTADRGAIH